MSARFEEVLVSAIHVGNRLRDADGDRVAVLKVTVGDRGLQQPIVLGENVHGLHLGAGLHRLTAVMQLGWLRIPASIKTISDDPARAAVELRYIEVIENLDRKELTALDRARHLAALHDVQQQLNPTKRRGGDRRSEDFKLQSLQFDLAEDLAERVGLSPRSVALAISISRGLSPKSMSRLQGTWLADHQAQLKLLSDQKPAAQEQILGAIFADPPKAASVMDALALLEGISKEPSSAPWTRLSGTFARLSKRDQFTFFDSHEDLVREWLAGRERAQ
ncbi:ParB/RepB/Spo0J family partition protein [Kaistia sp. MMO-174]|uniref:ParB/RepB/Spo0J family partition protein n=1 Tax=Kaistia sp. MMO-174 TaxID=3081256 RepID=UPI0030168D46